MNMSMSSVGILLVALTQPVEALIIHVLGAAKKVSVISIVCVYFLI